MLFPFLFPKQKSKQLFIVFLALCIYGEISSLCSFKKVNKNDLLFKKSKSLFHSQKTSDFAQAIFQPW